MIYDRRYDMIIDPPIEKMSAKVGNKYKLCVLASKRAVQIQKENIEKGVDAETPELTQAANEIWNGDVVIDRNSDVSIIKPVATDAQN